MILMRAEGPSSGLWSVRREGGRRVVLRRASSIWDTGHEWYLTRAEAEQWHTALSRIARRIRDRRFRSQAITPFWWCLLGCYRRGVTRMECYGGMHKQVRQVIRVEDTLLMVVEGYDWTAYPITLDELWAVVEQLAY